MGFDAPGDKAGDGFGGAIEGVGAQSLWDDAVTLAQLIEQPFGLAAIAGIVPGDPGGRGRDDDPALGIGQVVGLERQFGFLAPAFAIELGVGISGGTVRLVGKAFAMKIGVLMIVVVVRLLRGLLFGTELIGGCDQISLDFL